MADFCFLRLHEVDLRRYLPRFLVKDKGFLDVLSVHSDEHERLRLFLSEFAKQLFIESATWGLPSWEDVYESNPPHGADTEFRRTLVKAKMLGRQPVTKTRLEQLINAFTKGHDAYVEENVAPGCFQIHFPSVILWQEQMEEMLDATVPAHLTYNLHFEKDNADATIHYAAAPTLHTIYEIRPEEITDATAEAQRYVGAAVSAHTAYEVYPVTAQDAAIGSTLYADGIGSIYKSIEVSQT